MTPQVTGHRTAGQPDPGRQDRMGGHRMLDTPATDAVACLLAVSTTATTPDPSRAAGRSSGQTPSGRATTRTAQVARTLRAPTLLRTGLATAATVSCRWYAAVQLAPRRTALIGRFGSSVGRRGGCHPVYGNVLRGSGADRYGADQGWGDGCVAGRALVKLVSLVWTARRPRGRKAQVGIERDFAFARGRCLGWPRSIPLPRCGQSSMRLAARSA
jgi:hypothetical protein